MKEIWKDIEGYEGEYMVSNLGNVKSLPRMSWNGHVYFYKEGKVLAPRTATNYSRVGLSGKDYYIHRLAAQAFIPNPNNYPQINHKDENKRNNNIDNLEWCTQKYNNSYGTKCQRCADKLRGITRNNKPVRQYSKGGELINTFISAFEAMANTNINNASIGKVANGKKDQAGGYVWRWCQ